MLSTNGLYSCVELLDCIYFYFRVIGTNRIESDKVGILINIYKNKKNIENFIELYIL